ncbi:MAG: response regulator transcription factor [Anaerolineae bacterium]|nr:response regulator transcription factor [Thermoflexales bacterium]MDW8407365.1 response regulator transcription factor [Anaerolineae bacterium]
MGSYRTALTVLIVDDDAFNREGMQLFLAQEGFTVVEAGDDAAARLFATRVPFDAAVLDISIPPHAGARAHADQSLGIHLARHLKEINPRLGIVLFSAYEDRGREVLKLLEMGVVGLAYKLKGCRPSALLDALKAVLAGRVVIDPEVTNARDLADELIRRLTDEERPFIEHALAHVLRLTPTEQRIVEFIASSHTNEGMAEELGMAPKAIEKHVSRVYDKLGLNDVPPHLRKVTLLTKAWLIRSLRAT